MPTRFNEKFVVMLDDDMELFNHNFPIRTVDVTLEAARRRFQGSANPTILDKLVYTAEFLENKSLRDRNGDNHDGGIYQLHDR